MELPSADMETSADMGAAGLGTRNSFDLMNIRLEMSGGFIDLGGWAPLRLG